MEDQDSKDNAPKPAPNTPEENSKSYKLADSSNFSYKIKLNFFQDKLDINISQEDSFPELVYFSSFLLEEMQKKDRWFRLFETFLEVMEPIDNLFEEKKISIKKEEENLILILTHFEKKISDTILKIERKNSVEVKNIKENLIESHQNLIKRVKILEKENKALKEEIDKLVQIPLISKYIKISVKPFLNGIIKNEEDKNLIFSWINPNFNKVKATLIYSAKSDGDDASTFHKLCDNVKPTLVIVQSTSGKIFGGYATENWAGNDYKYAPGCFLFSLDKKIKINPGKKKNKYNMFCDPNNGPTFGNGPDLFICDGCLKNFSSNKTNAGYIYKKKEPGNQNEINNLKVYAILEGNTYFICKEVEVYAISQEQ